MKFYVIPPLKHPELLFYGDSFFCLAHLYVQHKSYREALISARKVFPSTHMLLDNGAAENSLVSEDTLIEIVKELKPDEVIAPDVLFDRQQTLENFGKFIELMKQKELIGHTKVFGCPQGQTKQEWMACFVQMCMSGPEVSTIGLSKISVPKCWNDATGDKMIAKSRNECVDYLLEHGLFHTKAIHLLGMGEYDEFEHYKKNNIPVRSSDSCYTILAALNNLEFGSDEPIRIPTPHDYFDMELTDSQYYIAQHNIQYLQNTYGKQA